MIGSVVFAMASSTGELALVICGTVEYEPGQAAPILIPLAGRNLQLGWCDTMGIEGEFGRNCVFVAIHTEVGLVGFGGRAPHGCSKPGRRPRAGCLVARGASLGFVRPLEDLSVIACQLTWHDYLVTPPAT